VDSAEHGKARVSVPSPAEAKRKTWPHAAPGHVVEARHGVAAAFATVARAVLDSLGDDTVDVDAQDAAVDVPAAAAATEVVAVDEARVAVDEARVAVVATVLVVVHIGGDFADAAAAGVAGVGVAALTVPDHDTVVLAVHVDSVFAIAFVAARGIRSTALELVLDWMTVAR
jgi:hypothetical protein